MPTDLIFEIVIHPIVGDREAYEAKSYLVLGGGWGEAIDAALYQHQESVGRIEIKLLPHQFVPRIKSSN